MMKNFLHQHHKKKKVRTLKQRNTGLSNITPMLMTLMFVTFFCMNAFVQAGPSPDKKTAVRLGKARLELWKGIKKNDILKVTRALRQGVHIDYRLTQYRTPLMWAIILEHEKMALWFIERGADVNAQDSYGVTPLMYAGYRGQITVMKRLIEAGASVHIKDKEGATALYWAAGAGQYEAVQLLLKAGANVNVQEKNGNTPLIIALFKRHWDVAGLLLKWGADPTIRNAKGYNAHHIARLYGITLATLPATDGSG